MIEKIRIERIKIPEDLRDCLSQPVVPLIETQKDVAKHFTGVVEAGADCRSTVGAIVKLNDQMDED